MDVIEKLSEWGCDTQKAIERMLGDRELYVNMLYKYREMLDIQGLCALIEDKKTGEAFETAHNLKGVFGNLSLDPLYKLTCRIVDILRAGGCEGLDVLTAELKTEKKKFDDILG